MLKMGCVQCQDMRTGEFRSQQEAKQESENNNFKKSKR